MKSAEKPRDSQQNFHPKNLIQNSDKKSQKKPEKICIIELPMNDEKYTIKLKITDASKMSITCNAKEDFTSCFNYAVVVSYEEFCELGKSFKLCDNIYDVFNTLKNIFDEISFSSNSIKEMKSNAKLIQTENDTVSLIIRIPLITGKFEEIKIGFKKAKKDIEEQFRKLKKKYLKIKSIVYMRKNADKSTKFPKQLLDELVEEVNEIDKIVKNKQFGDEEALKKFSDVSPKARQSNAALLTGRVIEVPKQKGKVISILFPELPLPCDYPTLIEHSRVNTRYKVQKFMRASEELSLINNFAFNQIKYSLDFINKRKVIAYDLKRSNRFNFKF